MDNMVDSMDMGMDIIRIEAEIRVQVIRATRMIVGRSININIRGEYMRLSGYDRGWKHNRCEKDYGCFSSVEVLRNWVEQFVYGRSLLLLSSQIADWILNSSATIYSRMRSVASTTSYMYTGSRYCRMDWEQEIC